jgi:peptidoglycan biosynthesis protein MviN/MurJ (putative lipid II flippase)
MDEPSRRIDRPIEIEPPASPAATPVTVTEAPLGTRSSAYIGSLNLAARASDRLLTFGQIVVVAWIFGAGPKADIYFLAAVVPLTIALVVGDPLGRGTFTALAPSHDRAKDLRFAAAGFVVAAALLLALTAVYVVAVSIVVELTAPGGSTALGPWLAFAPVILFGGMSGYLAGLLIWTERYGWAAFQIPLATALGLLLMIVVTTTTSSVTLTALAISAGYAFAFLAAFVAIASDLARGWRLDVTVHDLRDALLVPRRAVSPAIGQVLGGQAIVVIERALALTIGIGAVSTLAYARGISAAPVFVAQAIAAGVYPGIVRAESRGAMSHVRDSFMTALRTNLFVGCCFMLYFIAFGPGIGAALLSRGALSAISGERVGHALIAYAPSTAATGVLIFLVAVLFGIGEFRGILERALVGFVAYLVLAPALLPLRVWGLALAFSIAQVIAAVFALLLVSRKLSLPMRTLGRGLLPVLALLAPVAVVLAGYHALVDALGSEIAVNWRGVVDTGTSFVLMIVVASCVFLVAPLPESRRVRELVSSIPARLGRA